MKRGWIALVMVVIALILSGVEYLYLSTNTNMYLKMLDEADTAMEKNDIDTAQSVAKRLDHRLQEHSRGLDFFLYHGEIKDIVKATAALRRYAQTGDTAEFLAQSARIRRELISLKNTRIPRIEHIL